VSKAAVWPACFLSPSERGGFNVWMRVVDAGGAKSASRWHDIGSVRAPHRATVPASLTTQDVM
jgi:hypothetical protein